MIKILIPSLALFGLLSFSIKTNPHFVDAEKDSLFSTSAPSGKSGAPGEGNCTACHAGSTMSGTTMNTITFSGANNKYVPGETYQVTVTVNNTGKNGFQMTALDANDLAAGSFTAGLNSGTQTANGRKYVNHTASSGINSWTFSWVAPASSQGDVTFYLATNKTNQNSSTSGDQIFLSEMVIAEDSNIGVDENKADDFDLRFNAGSKQLFFNQLPRDMRVLMTDLNGKVLVEKNLSKGSTTCHFENEFSKGIYVITLGQGVFRQTIKVML